MLVIPIKTEVMKHPFDLFEFLEKYLTPFQIQEGDVLVISSKLVSISEGRVVSLKKIKVSEEAYTLANEYQIDERFCQVILQEADVILGGIPKVITTFKNGILVAYGGADRSNAPHDHAILWPDQPALKAEAIKQYIWKSFHKEVGVIISDSQVVPLRAGTYGVAIGIAGFVGMIDKRGESDLYGRKLIVSRSNIADNLASAANLVMGETVEQTPMAIIREAPIHLIDSDASDLTNQLVMDTEECMIFGCLPTWKEDVDQSEITFTFRRRKAKSS